MTADRDRMGSLAIRPYAGKDLETVVELWRDCDLVRPWNDPGQDVRRCLATQGSALFVGEHGGVIMSTIMVGDDGHRGWVYYLAVAPSFRGRGHGRSMMAHAESWLLARDVPKIQLMVRDSNGAVQDFYRRLGYVADPVVVLRRWLIEPPVMPPGRGAG